MTDTFYQLLVHPLYKTALIKNGDVMLDEKTGTAFPILQGIPVLLSPGQEHEDTTSRHYRQHYQLDAAAYDYTAEPESPIERQEVNQLHQTILSEIPPDAQWILDVGCGGAWLAKKVAGEEHNVISMDISDINPIRAVQSFSSPYHFGLVADVFALPFAENSLDCIVASEIIEHVPDPKTFVAELFKVLKPGGCLIITTPYNEQIRTSLCIHCNQLTPHNAHLHSFDEKKMQAILPAHARSVRFKIFNSKLFVRSGLQRLLSVFPQKIQGVADALFVKLTGKKAFRCMVVLSK